MDILGPLPETPRGNRYIQVFGDCFTKWKEAFPLKDTEAVTVQGFLLMSLYADLGFQTLSTLIKERTLKPKKLRKYVHRWTSRRRGQRHTTLNQMARFNLVC